jgi:hypothetical protein
MIRILIFASIVVAISMPAQACEIAKMFSGQLRFDIATVIRIPGKYPPRKGGEYALIRRSQTPILGRIDVGRAGFEVRTEKGFIGVITPKLVVEGEDDDCEKPIRLVIRPVKTGIYEGRRYGVYEIRNGNVPVGMIEGRFPEHHEPWPK